MGKRHFAALVNCAARVCVYGTSVRTDRAFNLRAEVRPQTEVRQRATL